MKHPLSILFIFFLFNTGISQSIEMQLISSTGGNDPQGKLHWTAGETLIAGNQKLTQGFHQGKLIITAIDEIPNDINIIVYPNPSQDRIQIVSKTNKYFDVKLLGLNGRFLLSFKNRKPPFNIDLSTYQTGHYFLQLSDENNLVKTFKIEKIK